MHLRKSIVLFLVSLAILFSFARNAFADQFSATFGPDGVLIMPAVHSCVTAPGVSKMYIIEDGTAHFWHMNTVEYAYDCRGGSHTFMDAGQKFPDFLGYQEKVGWYYFALIPFMNDNCGTNHGVCTPITPDHYFRMHRDANGVWSNSDVAPHLFRRNTKSR